jgi:hypothetical protein
MEIKGKMELKMSSIGVPYHYVGDENFEIMLDKYDGKNVKITIEVIDE